MSPGQQCARNRASLLAGSAGDQNASFAAHVIAPLGFHGSKFRDAALIHKGLQLENIVPFMAPNA
jgi:hypothetical protein